MSATPAGEATKTRKTRRTVKERIHALLGEVGELVDKHFDSSKAPSVTRTRATAAPIVTAINTPALLATAAPVQTKTHTTRVEREESKEDEESKEEEYESGPLPTAAPVKSKAKGTRKTKTKVPEGSVGGAGAAAAAAAPPTITQGEAKKLSSCPGGPKAFNEFVKKYREEQKEKGRELSYQEALKEAGPVFKVRCLENGSSAAANEARKAARREKRRQTQKVAFKSPTPAGGAAAGGAAAAATAGRVSPPRSLAEVAAPAPYLNEGLDNSQGMQKIVLEDVPYFMTLADKGLFKRTEDGNVGEWVGYLEEGGKIRETNQPDEA